MKNTNKLLVVILALAIAVSSIAVTALTTSAAGEVDTNMYEFFLGSDCYVGSTAGWDDDFYRDYEAGTYNLDYYEQDLFAPFNPATTQLEEGKTYKAIYWLTINKVNNEMGWEAKFMPTEEYYFNITNADIWDGVGPTSTAVVVPFKVTDINNVKLKMWTHGALIEGSCVEAIYVVGADYNVYAEGFFDIVVEGVANVGSNVEANRPADDEWTPSDPDAVVEPEPVEPVEGMNATILKPVLATQNYVDIIGEDSYGAQASLGENVKKFDASISTLISESFVQNMVETTEVVAGNQDNYVKMWTGTMTATESGEYTLIGRKIDNGFVMYVDGQKVYEYWGASHWFDGAEDRVVSDLGSFEVVAGESYDVEIYFLEIGGGDALEIFATTTPGDTNSGANINDVFDFDLVETTFWLADGGHWADFTNDTLVGAPTGDGGDGQCSEETALFEESFANLVWSFSNWEEKVVSSFAEPIEAYEADTAYMIVYEGTLVPNVSGEYTFGANAVDNGFYLEIGDDIAYEFWVGRRWNDTTGNTYTDSVTLEAGVEYPFFAAFLETNGGQALDLVASVDGGDRISVDELFTFSTKIIEEEDPEDPIDPEPTDEPTAEPTDEPTAEPTDEPTVEPTTEPTVEPTTEPTTEPTVEPTTEPTTEPTDEKVENVVIDWDFSDEDSVKDVQLGEGVSIVDGKAVFAAGNKGIALPDDIFEGADEVVIEMTLQPSALGSNYRTIISVGDQAGKWVVIGVMQDGSLRYAVATNGDDNSQSKGNTVSQEGGWSDGVTGSNILLTTDKEYNVKYVITKAETKVYVDDVLALTVPTTDKDLIGSIGGPVVLGKATKWTDDPSFEGTISNLKITTISKASGDNGGAGNAGNAGTSQPGDSSTGPSKTGDVAMIGAMLAAGVAALGGLKLRKKSK